MGRVKERFHSEPEAYRLAICGTEFNKFGEPLSAQAVLSLSLVAEFLEQWMKEKCNG